MKLNKIKLYIYKRSDEKQTELLKQQSNAVE